MTVIRVFGLVLGLLISTTPSYGSYSEDFQALGIGIQTTYQNTARSFTQQRGSAFGGMDSTPITAAPRPCNLHDTMRTTENCIQRSSAIQEALQEQAKYLNRVSNNKVLGASVQVSKAELEQTIKRLISWNRGNPQSLADMFFLQELNFNDQATGAKYTGYITPALNVKRTPDRRFRIPIYTKPKSGRLPSHSEITQGALAGKGLEIAWTDDPVELYFAQIQGAANAIFPDGTLATLTYAGNNGQPYKQIALYLKAKGYKTTALGNDSIRQWLRDNPDKTAEVLLSNPRFVFFNLKNGRPKTAIGSSVIPWHTIAVDDKHIPLGSVLLAELPVLDTHGQEQGSQWQLLFAQDRGGNIQGAARIDLYLGTAHNAEVLAQRITGYRRTFLLRPKNG
ncbi:MAG: hypothetical protein RLZZ422_896 [Pseudomonadota bacterium]|jgi:membrane-bound lytic murein transglycosylase A